MKNAHEKAIEIAKELMVAHLRRNEIGTSEQVAEKIAKFYLKMESIIADGFESLPD